MEQQIHEKLKIYNSSGTQIKIIDTRYECNWHSEVYYLNDRIYILMSCFTGILFINFYAIIENIKKDLIIPDWDSNGLITLWNFNTGEMIRAIK